MKFTPISTSMQQLKGKWGIFLESPICHLDELNVLANKDGTKSVEIKTKRAGRSLDANAALWRMLNEMAIKLHTSKDELYLDSLEKYGTFTHIVVKPEAVKRVMREWKTVRELGKVKINGKTGIQLQCYFGSSQMDSKEFSVLLDGVISDAKELGIDFISRQDRELMLNNRG